MSLKRINKEMGDNFQVIKEENLYGFSYIKIIRYWKTSVNYIDLNVSDYPFKRPFIINSNFMNFSHKRFGIIQQMNNSFMNYRVASMNDGDANDELYNPICFHCRSIFSCDANWSPSYSFYHMFKQVKLLNTFISSAVKLEVLKRNYKHIPEDVIYYIIQFLSIPIDEVFEIRVEPGSRLKIL
jgi:hypothetical protein